MPGLRDKVIINDGLDGSNHDIICGYANGIAGRFSTLGDIADELVVDDDPAKTQALLQKAQPIRADLETACKEYNAAQEALCKAARKYINVIDDAIGRTGELIDAELGLTP